MNTGDGSGGRGVQEGFGVGWEGGGCSCLLASQHPGVNRVPACLAYNKRAGPVWKESEKKINGVFRENNDGLRTLC